jgi:hypothetical protein
LNHAQKFDEVSEILVEFWSLRIQTTHDFTTFDFEYIFQLPVATRGSVGQFPISQKQFDAIGIHPGGLPSFFLLPCLWMQALYSARRYTNGSPGNSLISQWYLQSVLLVQSICRHIAIWFRPCTTQEFNP